MNFSVNIFTTALLCAIFAGAIAQGTNIYKDPSASDVNEIKTSTTPWVSQDLVPKIEAFKKNVIDGFKASDQVQKIWGTTWDSATSRQIFFKAANAFFTGHKSPVPTALANIISKSAGLFDQLTKQTNFEAIAVSTAEFLLTQGKEPDSDTAAKYVKNVEEALKAGDPSTPEGELSALWTGYVAFIQSQGFDIDTVVNELALLLTSQFIVLAEQ